DDSPLYRLSPMAQPKFPLRGPFTRKKLLLCNGLGPEPLQPGHPRNIVISRKNHKHEHKGQAEAESYLLRAFGQRAATLRLNRIEQKMSAIEQRYWEEVQQADRDRQHAGEVDNRKESQRSDLSRNLGDAHDAPDLLRRFSAGKHAAEIGERHIDDVPRSLDSQPDGGQRSDLLGLDIVAVYRPADAENTDAVDIAEIVGDFGELRHRRQRQMLAAAVDAYLQGISGASGTHLLHVGERLDSLSVDGKDDVTDLETGMLR